MSRVSSGQLGRAQPLDTPDFYPSPPCAVAALLAVEALPDLVWEPACGDGVIVREMRRKNKVIIASDLNDWGCAGAKTGVDFLMELKAPAGATCIVTNPPYSLAEEFIRHGLTLVPKVVMLLRLAFLEGKRWEKGFGAPLARVHVFANRLPMMHRHGYDGAKVEGGMIAFAWFVWDREHQGAANIGWVNWRDHWTPEPIAVVARSVHPDQTSIFDVLEAAE